MLFVVGTPIGNLEDMSDRGIRILNEVDAIGAEDTRHTRKLLSYFDIKKPTFSFHQHNERHKTEVIIDRLKNGENIAIVSDAGMPLISDAGQILVKRLQEEQLEYTCVPGPSAVETALVLSGLPTDRYTFFGFVPRDNKDRGKLWEDLTHCTCTAVLFESPRRLCDTLKDMQQNLTGRQVVVAREMTKLHEERISGSPLDIIMHFEQGDGVKGECVILVEPAEESPEQHQLSTAIALVGKVQSLGDVSRSNAAKIVAELTGIPRRTLYRESLEDE
jgi:16S rRNA (cytidine1402-2'-O)-methyltransferase